jgi:hypothetical protein
MIVIGNYLRKYFSAQVSDETILAYMKNIIVVDKGDERCDKNYNVSRLAIFDKVESLLVVPYAEFMGALYDDDIMDLYKDPLIEELIKKHNELILTPVYGALLHLYNRSSVHVREEPTLVKDFCDVVNVAHRLEYYENPERLNVRPVDILAYEFAINFDKDDEARMCDITNRYLFGKFWISIAEQFDIFKTN